MDRLASLLVLLDFVKISSIYHYTSLKIADVSIDGHSN